MATLEAENYHICIILATKNVYCYFDTSITLKLWEFVYNIHKLSASSAQVHYVTERPVNVNVGPTIDCLIYHSLHLTCVVSIFNFDNISVR